MNARAFLGKNNVLKFSKTYTSLSRCAKWQASRTIHDQFELYFVNILNKFDSATMHGKHMLVEVINVSFVIGRPIGKFLKDLQKVAEYRQRIAVQLHTVILCSSKGTAKTI